MWLVTEIHHIIITQKEKLPNKWKKENYPTVLWVAAPLHKNFENNTLRCKFNACLEKVVDTSQEMHIIRMKKE